MAESDQNRFNLVDEKWIPVANEGLVSLSDIFEQHNIAAIGGNPIQKIAITKLLLAIAQSAYTPKDDDDWRRQGAIGMADKSLEYLNEKRDCFWLYGEKPFLQMPILKKMINERTNEDLKKTTNQAKKKEILEASLPKSMGSGNMPDLPSENNTVLTQNNPIETDAEKAMFLISLMNFALGGKRVEKGLPPFSAQCVGKTDSAKAGPSIGNHWGYLHSFLTSNQIIETIWLNLFTHENITRNVYWTAGLGIAPWESLPESEVCQIAQSLKNSYMGTLVAMCRFIILNEEGIYYAEGIQYPSHKNGWREPSMSVLESDKEVKLLWTDPNKRPWRSLVSILSFMSNLTPRGFDCQYIRIGLTRARLAHIGQIGIWSGGLKVRANAGDQSVKGDDDFVESEFLLQSAWLGENWFLQLQKEMSILEELSKNVYGCTMGFFKEQLTEGKDQAAQASSLFWQLAEHHFQKLIDACGTDTAESLRPIFAQIALKAYDTYCPNDTARQLDAWASCRPQLGRFFIQNSTLQSETHPGKGA